MRMALTTTTREDQQSTSYIKLWPWTIKCANVSRKKPRKVDQHIFRPKGGRNQNQLPQGKAIESNGSILMPGVVGVGHPFRQTDRGMYFRN